MTTSNGNRYTLSVKPVDFSLTAGTNIPAPLESPPHSPSSAVRPPTPGGGPLTSHPTTPEYAQDIPGAFPPTPEPEKESSSPAVAPIQTSATNGARPNMNGADSFRTPISPASATATQNTSSPEQTQRRPSGVRKLLSLSSLRSSFTSSRTSLSLPRQSNDVPQHQPYPQANGLKRPSSPSIASTTASTYYAQPRPELQSKKSGSWFRRKSQLFMLNGDGNMLDAVEENQRPDTRESKRLKERDKEPAPLLPEIGTLSGGDGEGFGGGEIGWDEGLFRR